MIRDEPFGRSGESRLTMRTLRDLCRSHVINRLMEARSTRYEVLRTCEVGGEDESTSRNVDGAQQVFVESGQGLQQQGFIFGAGQRMEDSGDT